MDWPWVRYYVHKGGTFWTDGETSHTISNNDIIRIHREKHASYKQKYILVQRKIALRSEFNHVLHDAEIQRPINYSAEQGLIE